MQANSNQNTHTYQLFLLKKTVLLIILINTEVVFPIDLNRKALKVNVVFFFIDATNLQYSHPNITNLFKSYEHKKKE